jgi:hypothetical protein
MKKVFCVFAYPVRGIGRMLKVYSNLESANEYIENTVVYNGSKPCHRDLGWCASVNVQEAEVEDTYSAE